MPDIQATWKPSAFPNTSGVAAVAGQELAVELLTADPTNVSGVPRVWINLTDKKIKFYDGTTQYASVALT